MDKILVFFPFEGIFSVYLTLKVTTEVNLQMQRKNISQESLLNASGKIKCFKKLFVLTF